MALLVSAATVVVPGLATPATAATVQPGTTKLLKLAWSYYERNCKNGHCDPPISYVGGKTVNVSVPPNGTASVRRVVAVDYTRENSGPTLGSCPGNWGETSVRGGSVYFLVEVRDKNGTLVSDFGTERRDALTSYYNSTMYTLTHTNTCVGPYTETQNKEATYTATLASSRTCADVVFEQNWWEKLWTGQTSSTPRLTVNLRQRACWDGTKVWWADTPQSRVYTSAYPLSASICSNSGTSVNQQSTDSVVTTCATTISQPAGSAAGTQWLVALDAPTTSGDFYISPGQSLTRYYSLRITPHGCVFVSGVGRPNSVNC